MELEEMKTLWTELSTQLEKQTRLTDSLVLKMTKAGYRNKISKILIPETIGSSVCLAVAAYILVNSQRLSPWYLLVCGILSAFALLVLPILSLRSLHKMRSVNIAANNYKQSLSEHSKARIHFVFAQKISFYLRALLFVSILPVTSQLIAGKDLFVTDKLWLWYTLGFPLFYLLSKWVFKSYSKILSDAGILLKELES